ncbi:MAG: DUF4345 domain-containing protein [Cyanobacteria bacterium P01_H01_bin.121]
MKRLTVLTVIFLAVSGLLLLVIGSTILLVPHTFYAGDGIVLGDDPSLLSEIRAPGGLLATSALLILAGALRSGWRYGLRPGQRSLALTLTVLVYGSFGLARLLSLALDGVPSTELVVAAMIELSVAGMGLVLICGWSRAAATLQSRTMH